MAANILLKSKAKNFRKSYEAIKAEESRLNPDQKSAFNALVDWVAEAGMKGKGDNTRLTTLSDTLHSYTNGSIQDELYTAVNTFVSTIEGLAETQKRNANTWIDFYQEIKDYIKAPAPKPRIQQPTPTTVNPKPTPTSPTTPTSPKPTYTPPITPTTPTTPTEDEQTPPVRKPEHFSFAALGGLILTYGGMLLLGALPFLIGWLSSWLFDTGHWFFGILAAIAALYSIGIAFYGWIAAAALAIPLWLLSTSWWWLGVAVLLVELYFVGSACMVTDDDN